MRKWLSADNLKWLVATLAVPIALGFVSYMYERSQTQRQATEARLRLYTELLSKREEADTGVRKGIFDKVLETYLKPGAEDLDAKLVALELLAVNFNDSLDLSPLFWQLARQIDSAPRSGRSALRAQLQRISRAVKDRQIEVLEVVGAKRDGSLDLDDLSMSEPLEADLHFTDPDPFVRERQRTRHFKVEVAEHDAAGRRVWARVSSGDKQWAFWVDAFDFPLVNFTRISTSERFTLLLKSYNPPSAELTLIYFPSSRSGVKDKPFIDEVISGLVHGQK